MSTTHLNRRALLQKGVTFASVLAWHTAGHLCGADKAKATEKGKVRFTALRLLATRLDEMRTFYTKTLGLPLTAEAKKSLTVQFGETVIEFEEAPEKQEPFYHFAFNISENKFKAAKEWLAKRCALLKTKSGADEIFFEKWNAHAVYFHDPAGNIGELIAQHTLANGKEGAFELDDILYASEIGLVSSDPKQLGTDIGTKFGLKGGGSMFVGDASGYFILPPVDRLWIPEEKQKAAVFAADVTLAAPEGSKEFRPEKLPYVIRPKA